jgi:dynamin-binding protein
MSSDEDHNYFFQTRRRFPDYNVDAHLPAASASIAAADALPTLPNRYYRQSQQSANEPQPSVTSAAPSGTTLNPRGADPFRSDKTNGCSPDPHEFYRQYRDSFRRGGGGAYTGLDGMNTVQSAWQTSGSTRDRASRLESRFAQSPSSKPSIPPVQTQRNRQSSLQALVAKFNQSPDEVPPIPNTTSSPPSSANQSPSGPVPPRPLRRPVPTESSSKEASYTPRDTFNPAASIARRSPGLLDKRKETGKRVPQRAARGGSSAPAVSNHAYGSLSLTDLTPQTTQQPTRRLLFGEIAGPISTDFEFGIEGSRVRRGSEGSVRRLDRSARDEDNPDRGSPSSPTAWYRGVTPSLEGIDLSKPIPPRPTGLHRRSQSEITPGTFSSAPHSSAHHSSAHRPQRNMGTLSPTQEQDTPTSSPQSNKATPTSRIPVSNRRPSGSSADQKDSFASREAALPAPLNLKTPERGTRNVIPRKSPQSAGPDPTRRSPQLAAFISEPPPVRSPPLRSSRPRQPVSTATTYASRARAAATVGVRPQQTDKPAKPLPELGGVDLAARRERIQRAFTTKVKAREIETEKKRASLILEARMQKGLHEKPLGPTNETLDEGSQDDQTVPQQESAAPAKPQEKERTLTINTGGPDGKRTIKIPDEDSPTLGTASFLRPGMLRDDSSEGETSSGTTSSTEETYFEQDPSIRGSVPESRNRSDVALSGTPLQGMDLGELESIQIMLQETPANERSDAIAEFGSRLQTQSTRHFQLTLDFFSLTSITEQTTASAEEASHGSAPTSGSTAQGPWSPKSNSTLTTTPGHHEGDSHQNFQHSADPYDPYREGNFVSYLSFLVANISATHKHVLLYSC